jgi:hypothetical protein
MKRIGIDRIRQILATSPHPADPLPSALLAPRSPAFLPRVLRVLLVSGVLISTAVAETPSGQSGPTRGTTTTSGATTTPGANPGAQPAAKPATPATTVPAPKSPTTTAPMPASQTTVAPGTGTSSAATEAPDATPAMAASDTARTAPPPASWAVPTNVKAIDTIGDGGKSITISWTAAAGAVKYRIERSEGEGPFEEVDFSKTTTFDDNGVEDGKPYRYRVVALGPNGEEGVSAPSGPASSSPQWFNSWLWGVLIATLAFMALVFWFIRRARLGQHLFIRRLAGLEAVDEAVGRATEMGKSVLYVPGIGDISYISTIASLNVLGEIAKKTAQYGTKLQVPNYDPVVYTVAREVVKGAYTEVGRPDAYDPDSVFFLVQAQMAYAAAVSGIMTREKPAANFLLGYFSGEALLLAETGSSTGAIQIAGTDMTTQLPFFVVACDYTLLGEELFAASAYLSREPLMLGALKGQDWGKFIFMIILVVATIVSLVFGFDGSQIFRVSGR